VYDPLGKITPVAEAAALASEFGRAASIEVSARSVRLAGPTESIVRCAAHRPLQDLSHEPVGYQLLGRTSSQLFFGLRTTANIADHAVASNLEERGDCPASYVAAVFDCLKPGCSCLGTRPRAARSLKRASC